MKRRNFIKTTAIGTLALGLGSCSQPEKTHILTLSFDDGFKKSFYRIADIYEQFDLKACLNVVASAHLPNYIPPDKWQSVKLGDFNDWNVLQKRGHEIMPHSWEHQNLTKIPFQQAQKLITKCLNYFEENLDGFEIPESVYSFAFNASTPELEKFALSKVKAIRTHGNSPINPIPLTNSSIRLACSSFGPENADIWVEGQINNFLNSSGGWLVLNLHGLDNEGWGPISSAFLINLLKKLSQHDYLDILPVGEVLKNI